MTIRLARQEYVLAVLSTAKGAAFTPVQVQKLFFLLDARAANKLGGGYFAFEAYDYGPFDVSVYNELDQLSYGGSVFVDRSGYLRTYRLTADGQAAGEGALERLPSNLQAFITDCSDFVRSHNFADLVSAIYRAFPDMKARSIFKDPA